ncbi:MAG: hypothetical protein ACR2QE_03325, partial [Acidimicrobiales bacterium]
MASMLKKAILYLGLGPDEEYDSYNAYAESQPTVDQPPELVFDEPEPVAPSAVSNVRPLTADTAARPPAAEPEPPPATASP